jgi:Protein  of unknown function (DUF3018)
MLLDEQKVVRYHRDDKGFGPQIRRLECPPPTRYVQRMDAKASTRRRIARHRAVQRERGLRPVVLWLLDVNDRGYRDRLARECRQLARLTDEEDAIATGFAGLKTAVT